MAGRVHQFLGGSPLSVLIRLVLISLLVGVLLSWLSWTPNDIIRWIVDFFDWAWSSLFGSFNRAVDYFLLGAAIVIPIFLISRLLKWRS
ncbi:DUF6460 domain-containing protein [Consotaella salsifontis]|uniref:DUF6460 domain-containing protein n=1 Tax=Consotaella salsifontis TaxID=1365950 RepID=A0A1T4MMR6_9HYPH|nr:DUF6460 domain-containing protein [Consotaella salsifontis]SJZ68400.1 hypothetical protein SAMN05428963_102197 [Consotaella salsifontis]